MLNSKALTTQIENNISATLVPTLEETILQHLDYRGKVEKKKAQDFAKTFEKLFKPAFAKLIAEAVDAYIKNMSINGNITIMPGQVATSGGPHAQVNLEPIIVSIGSPYIPEVNGKMPNSMGIK